MRRAIVVLVVPVLLMGWDAVPAAAEPTPQVTGPRGTVTGPPVTGTAVMRGTIVAADTGAPVRRASVRAVSADGQDNRVALSDDQGRFELKELVGGHYSVTASKTGFVTLQYGQRRPGERGTPVELTAGQTLDKLTIGLPRGSVITGRITDEAGEPLAEAQVQVLRSTFGPTGRRMMPTGRGDTTDDQGTFRIYGLMPGEYLVSATVRNATMGMMMANGRPAADVDQGYAPTYFPGTPAMADAQKVTVGVGQEVGGIAFGLTPTRIARVSGRVTGGKPGDAEGYIMVTPADGVGAGAPMAGGGPVLPDGTFAINGVAPGRYELRVLPRGRSDEELVGLTTITVAGADVSNVTIAMQRPGAISGRIEFEGGPPAGVQPAQVRVMPMPVDGLGTRMMMNGPARTADDFTFTVRGVSGPVLLRSGGAPGWYVKAILHDSEDVTDTPIALTPGVDVQGVRVLLTQSVTTLSGSVRDDRGNAVVDAAVVVFPADESKWGPASRFLRSTRPDTQGRFEMKALPPHAAYRVIAVQGLEDGQIYDSEFLTSLRDRAERLALGEGETKAIDVRLKP